MRIGTTCTAVNVLYYLYFENRELVHYYERVWSEDGMTYEDVEFAYVFCGAENRGLPVDLDTCYFFVQSGIIEETSGDEHQRSYILVSHHRTALSTILKERAKNVKTVAE